MKLFKLLTFVLLLPIMAFGNIDYTGKRSGKFTKEKTIHKEFSGTTNPEFNLVNLYGNVNITTWDGATIVVDVQVIINGDNENEVQQGLKKIDITFDMNTNKNILEVATNGTSEVKIHREIHYQIKLPKTCPLIVYNNFGDLNIDETDASATLMVGYGNLTAGKLNGTKTKLYFGYSTNSVVNYVENADVWGSFSDYEIKKASKLKLDKLNSSNGTVGHLNSLVIKNCKFGSLTVDEIKGDIETDSEYLVLNVNNASGKKMDIKSEYGSVAIKNWNYVNSNFDISQAKLDLGYSNIPFKLNLNINSCASFTDSVLNTLPSEIKKELKQPGKRRDYVSYYLNKYSTNNLTVTMEKGIFRFNKIEQPIAGK